jgi:hypothetical protein
MDEMGVAFEAEVFRTTVSPMSLELKNATFTDKETGEKLFYIDSARLGLRMTDLYSWQLSRTFEVESTDIQGAEIWVRFDDEGNSNFSNLQFTTKEGERVKFKYSSIKFALRDAPCLCASKPRTLRLQCSVQISAKHQKRYGLPSKRFPKSGAA